LRNIRGKVSDFLPKIYETDDREANASWSRYTYCCRRFEGLHPHLVIWWKCFEALTVGLVSARYQSFERSSAALLCSLIESALPADYSCDYVTERCRQRDKNENPLYYLPLIFVLLGVGLFCFSVPDLSRI